MKKTLLFTSIAIAALAVVALATALSSSPFGETVNNGGGSFTLISDTSAGHAGYGGLDYTTPSSFQFSDINYLGTQQTPDAGDTCVAGSPRFQLNVDTNGDGSADKNVFVYTQFAPNGCPGDTGNLIGTASNGEIVGTYDLSQVGGSGYTNYDGAVAFFAANPTYTITGIQLVVDSGWAFDDGRQAITVTPTVDVTLHAPANMGACKKGGWQTVVRKDGSTFKNQGDCIQYVNTGK